MPKVPEIQASSESTEHRRRRLGPSWFLVSPSVALLLLWMLVPLSMTIYFSLIRYNLL
nr:sugar ABC transporter permease [Pseudomonas sp.]